MEGRKKKGVGGRERVKVVNCQQCSGKQYISSSPMHLQDYLLSTNVFFSKLYKAAMIRPKQGTLAYNIHFLTDRKSHTHTKLHPLPRCNDTNVFTLLHWA